MPRFILPSFAKGEIAPALYGRVDTAAYAVALKQAKNAIVHPQGGASNRPGQLFIGPVKDHAVKPRFIEFDFKTGDAYVLEFGHQYMRVIRGDGHVVEAAKGVQIVSRITGGFQLTYFTPHGYATNDELFLTGFSSIPLLNNRRVKITVLTTTTVRVDTDHSTTRYIFAPNPVGTYAGGGTSAKIYEITTPYDSADLDELKYVQSADVMTLTHPDYPVYELSRFDHDDWVLSEPDFVPEVVYPTGEAVSVGTPGAVTERYRVTAFSEDTFEESLPGVNATARAITGVTRGTTTTILCAGHGFSNGDEVVLDNIVGTIELNGRRFFVTNQSTNQYDILDHQENPVDSTNYTAYVSGGFSWQTFVRITNGATVANNTVSWTAQTGIRRYAVYKEKNGLFGLIGETELNAFLDSNISPDLDISPPHYSEPFLQTGDFPGAVSYYEQRRVFGGSTDRPDTATYSKVGTGNNFTSAIPLQPDDSFETTLASLKVNEIRHFVPGNDLIVLTSESEWRVNSGTDAGFSPDTVRQKPQSAWGSSHLRPFLLGNTVIFLANTEAEVRSLGYSVQIDGYLSSNLSVLANHLFENFRVVDWCYARTPDPRIYCVRSDGVILTLTFEQEQEVIAWTTWETPGLYETVATMRRGASITEDAVFSVVQRTVPSPDISGDPNYAGTHVRWIERTYSRIFDEVQDCFFVDAGASFQDVITLESTDFIPEGGGTVFTTPPITPDLGDENKIIITLPAGESFTEGEEVEVSGVKWSSTDYDADGNLPEITTFQSQRGYVWSAGGSSYHFTTDAAGTDFITYPSNATYLTGGKVRRVFTTIPELWHLDQRTVVVLQDGDVQRDLFVDDGTLTLASSAARVQVGLPYVCDLETLNIEAPQGTVQGRPVQVPTVTLRFQKSREILVGPNKNQLSPVPFRSDEAYGVPTRLYTGDHEALMRAEWNKTGNILIRQKDPLPMTLLAAIPHLEFGDD